MINSPTPVLRRQTKNIDDLVAVLRLLFGLGFEKNYSTKLCVSNLV